MTVKVIKVEKPIITKQMCTSSNHWMNIIYFGDCAACNVRKEANKKNNG